jgi:hypothetical protein
MKQPSDGFVYGDFAAAVAALRTRWTGSEPPWKAPVRTNKLEQRRFVLHLCDWGVGEDELNHAIPKQVRYVYSCLLITELLMQVGEGGPSVKSSLLACLYASMSKSAGVTYAQ